MNHGEHGEELFEEKIKIKDVNHGVHGGHGEELLGEKIKIKDLSHRGHGEELSEEKTKIKDVNHGDTESTEKSFRKKRSRSKI